MKCMELDANACYRALVARDRRFDGLFYTGVHTTGVYCRPVCPARTPALARCAFFTRAAEAERAGFRACFRCRPELAPGLAPVDSIPRLVRSAVAEIDAGALDRGSVDALATSLGVTSRHLRRALEAELGVSPIEYAQTRRLAMAKRLLHDTSLPLAEVAFASGFASVRRFNALFQQRFRCAPSQLRGLARRAGRDEPITLRLEHRAPYDWKAMLRFLRARAIPGVEEASEDEYRRTVFLEGHIGALSVRPCDGRGGALLARVSRSLAPVLATIVTRLRALFDLDDQPHVVAAHLRRDAALRPLVARHPGLRVPGAFDPLELAVRAILGQQVSVAAATTLGGRIAEAFGTPYFPAQNEGDGLRFLFPQASVLRAVSSEAMQRIGLPSQRARAILALAEAMDERRIELSSGGDPARAIEQLERLPGVGAWTSSYLAMRALRWSDAFPAGDLALRKSLGVSSARAAEERASAWSPFRAYGAMQLWCSLSEGA